MVIIPKRNKSKYNLYKLYKIELSKQVYLIFVQFKLDRYRKHINKYA